jgi:hypothetical protein
MEQITESATSNVKSIETNISNDTDSEKEPITLTPPIPNVLALGLLFLSTIGIILAGYIHGKMDLLTVLKNAVE